MDNSFETDRGKILQEIRASEARAREERFKIIEEDPLLTKDLRYVLTNLDSSSHGSLEFATLEKVRLAQYLRPEISKLSTAPLVYLASGNDILFGLAMGSRNIKLVDDVIDVSVVADKLKPFEPEISGSEIKVKFDFGQGKQEVSISVCSNLAQKFKFPESMSAVFSYLGTEESSPFVYEDAIRKLSVGGFIFDDKHDPLYREQNCENYGLKINNIPDCSVRVYKKISEDSDALRSHLEGIKRSEASDNLGFNIPDYHNVGSDEN